MLEELRSEFYELRREWLRTAYRMTFVYDKETLEEIDKELDEITKRRAEILDEIIRLENED